VDKLLNGNQSQMENAILQLKDKLCSVENTYGFFFYAGHGVQSGGENFLIPVDANIPSENFLRNRSVSVQTVLDELNDAGNSLNVVVLDACRDNPFGWSRSGSRGLTIVTRQPSGSIIVYATSAGMQASDGDGRNGLFTSQLINNLATPGLEVNEVFRRTGQDVARVSDNKQVPAIYSQFFETAFLGEVSGDFGSYSIPVATVIIGQQRESDPSKYWSVGASMGTSFVYPWITATVRGTIAPLKYLFLELGVDMGFVSGDPDIGYNSFCPFMHAAFYFPFTDTVGVYAGAGGGYMMANYKFNGLEYPQRCFTADAFTGINIFNALDISYTFRTNFEYISSKLSVGYSYRFK